MKISLRCATLATLFGLAMAASSSLAQQAAPRNPAAQPRTQVAPPSGGAVAVIDISKIFKEHPGFRAKLEDMKKDVAAAETTLRADRDEIKKVADTAKGFNPGSPNYQEAEERIATMQAQLQLKVNLQKKQFMDKEARIYYEVYTQIEREVADFALRHGISLVLRYNDIEMNPNQRDVVLAGVNQAVVFQNRIDITDDILDKIKPPVPQGGGTGPIGRRDTLPR